jgi:hypothetical protein
MPLLADLFQVAILLACLGSLALLSRLALPGVPFSLHVCLAPLVFAGLLFFLEHFLPLGQLPWLWLPGLGIFVYLVRKKQFPFLQESVTWYFLWGFAFCFMWRFSFPDIYPFSDRVNDHVNLASYSSGGLLPAEDVWMKGEKSNTYYIFQYYAAGLIHRFIGCSLGLTFHLGFCVMVGLTVAAAASGVEAATRSWKAGVLTLLYMTMGGNGATLVTPLMNVDGPPSPLAAERFIGSYAMPETPAAQSKFGRALIHLIGASKVDTPLEYYSYAIYIGDYHPSLSCYLFLCIALLAIGTAERVPFRSNADRVCVIAAIASLFYMVVSSTWTSPLQAMLIVAWLVYRQCTGRRDSWQFLGGSALACFAAIFPYFVEFSHETRGYPVKFLFVHERAPFLNWLLIMFPAVLIGIVGSCVTIVRPFARMTLLLGLSTMAFTYFFEMHSIYGGPAELYDTAMKWWGWVFTSTLLLGLICVWPYRIPRNIALVTVILIILTNSYILEEDWQKTDKTHMGRLDGYAWFTDDGLQNVIFHELKALPKGVLLESAPPPPANGSACITLAQFTGHYSVGGWPWFELLWRGNRDDIATLDRNRDAFYTGTLADPLGWLGVVVPGGVDYIVWLQRDNKTGDKMWSKVNDQIKAGYDWHETYHYGEDYWGIWMRRK